MSFGGSKSRGSSRNYDPLRAKISTLENNNKHLLDDIDLLNKKYDLVDRRNKTLQVATEHLDSVNEDLYNKNYELRRKIRELETRITVLEKQLSDIKSTRSYQDVVKEIKTIKMFESSTIHGEHLFQ